MKRTTIATAAICLLLGTRCQSAVNKEAPAQKAGLPLTYCNPLPLPDYQSGFSKNDPRSRRWMHSHLRRDYREMADPTIIKFRGLWYLFATCGILWYSDDLVNWTHHEVKVDGLGAAPTVVERDGWLYLTSNGNKMWRARHPFGPWELLGEIKDESGKPTSWNDPCLFVDDDGTFYCYYGLGKDGIFVVKLRPDDPARFAEKSIPCFKFNPSHIWERFGDLNQDPTKSSTEGSWITKHNGTYYLQYSAPGTIFKNYAVGCYTSKNATGPWKYQKRNPILVEKGGLVNGCGHHCVFEGPDGNLWCVYTTLVRIENGFERRVGMDPVGFDKNGEMYVKGPTETPQLAPGLNKKPYLGNDAGLIDVSCGWETASSSCVDGHEPALAVDNNIRTWWEAADSSSEQWMSVNLEREYEVSAARTMFADRGLDYAAGVIPAPYKYTIEGSLNGKDWFVMLDRSDNNAEKHIEYDSWSPAKARYVRLVVKSAPKGMRMGVWEFTVFGKATDLKVTGK